MRLEALEARTLLSVNGLGDEQQFGTGLAPLSEEDLLWKAENLVVASDVPAERDRAGTPQLGPSRKRPSTAKRTGSGTSPPGRGGGRSFAEPDLGRRAARHGRGLRNAAVGGRQQHAAVLPRHPQPGGVGLTAPCGAVSPGRCSKAIPPGHTPDLPG
jgi:hypothetical protein